MLVIMSTHHTMTSQGMPQQLFTAPQDHPCCMVADLLSVRLHGHPYHAWSAHGQSRLHGHAICHHHAWLHAHWGRNHACTTHQLVKCTLNLPDSTGCTHCQPQDRTSLFFSRC